MNFVQGPQISVHKGATVAEVRLRLVGTLGDSKFQKWGSIRGLAFSPDGRHFAAGADDLSVSLWNRKSGELLWQAKGDPTKHGGNVQVAFSSKSEFLFVSELNDRLEFTAVQIPHLQSLDPCRTYWPRGIATSPTDCVVALGSLSGTVKLIRYEGDDFEETTLQDAGSDTRCVAFSRDGGLVASGHEDGRVLLWHVSSGSQLASLHCTEHRINALCFSPNGDLLAFGTDKGEVALRDLAPSGMIRLLGQHQLTVHSIGYTGCGRWLLSSGPGTEATVRVWNVAQTYEEEEPLIPDESLSSACMAFSQQGSVVATTYLAHVIKFWDMQTRRELPVTTGPRGHVCGLAFDPSGEVLFAANRDGTLSSWNVRTLTKTSSLANGGSSQIAVHPSGRVLAVSSESPRFGVVIRDALTLNEEAFLPNEDEEYASPMAFSPDGKLLAASGNTGVIHLWDWEGKVRVKSLTGHPDGTDCLLFSPCGSWLVTIGEEDGTIRVWNARDGFRLSWFAEEAPDVGPVKAVAFSHDSSLLAEALWNGLIRIRRVGTWEIQNEWPAHKSLVCGNLAFHPHSHLLASTAWDGSVRLWDATTAQLVAHEQIGPPRGNIFGLAFDPTGKTLATANGNGTISLLTVQ